MRAATVAREESQGGRVEWVQAPLLGTSRRVYTGHEQNLFGQYFVERGVWLQSFENEGKVRPLSSDLNQFQYGVVTQSIDAKPAISTLPLTHFWGHGEEGVATPNFPPSDPRSPRHL